MRPRPRLEEAGDEPVRATGDGPADHRDHQGERRRQGPGHERRRDEGAQAADEELPVHAEVEQPGLERHREAQAGEDERRGADQGLGDGSKGCGDVVSLTALDRGHDATRVAERPEDYRRVALDHAGERAADRCERIRADLLQVIDVRQHDHDRTEEERGEDREGRDNGATECIADWRIDRSVSPQHVPSALPRRHAPRQGHVDIRS